MRTTLLIVLLGCAHDAAPPRVAPAPRGTATAPVRVKDPDEQACFEIPVRYEDDVPSSPRDVAAFETQITACRNAARCLYDAGHEAFASNRFEQAAPGLLAAARAGGPDALHAAVLALESLSVLGMFTVPRRTACFSVMEKAVPPLVQSLCKDSRASGTKECLILRQVEIDLLRLHSEAKSSHE